MPIFQYAIFYNGLLEFSDCATMTVNGPVHANGPIYTGSSQPLVFNEMVTTSSTLSSPAWDGFSQASWSGPVTFNGGLLTNVPPILLEISTNFHMLIDLPPTGENPASMPGNLRLYNQAQTVLLVSNSSVTLRVQTNNQSVPGADPAPSNIVVSYNATNQNPTNFAGLSRNFPFLSITNSFTDQREQDKTVLVTQIDLGEYAQWIRTNPTVQAKLPAGSGLYPTILYVTDNRTNTAAQMTAVRLTNGIAPPVNGGLGFTLATRNPLYVIGNYNCTNAAYLGTTNTSATVPCAFISDALTILSQNWADALSSGSYASRQATNTTINAAILTGNVPSTGATSTTFSGGVHNLPRLLEDWQSPFTSQLTLNTSLVNLYASTTATTQFESPGVYYLPPNRLFSFDPNFNNPAKQPPGTPCLIETQSIFTQQPQSQAVNADSTVVFSAAVSNSIPVLWQWYFNGLALRSGTNASLTLTNVQTNQAGVYWAVVRDLYAPFETAASSNAILTVLQLPPAILVQPFSRAAQLGSNATFTVLATGIPVLGFQWLFNGQNIPGASNASLSIANMQATNVGVYNVVVSNAFGSVVSDPASLSLATPPAFLWARSASNALWPNFPQSAVYQIAVDPSGNVYGAGTFYASTLDFGGAILTNTSVGIIVQAVFLCKYDAMGNFLWANAVATDTPVPEVAVRTDSSGNVYLAGQFTGTAVLGGTTLVSTDSSDIFLAKYNSQGNVLWAQMIGASDPSAGSIFSLAVDAAGNSVLAGMDSGSATFGTVMLTNSQAFLAKFDTAGNLLWANEAAPAWCLALGPAGDICIAGSPGFLAKYDSAGDLLWSEDFSIDGWALALDGSDNIYIAGGPDLGVAKCDPQGQLLWIHQTAGSQDPWATGIVLDQYNNVYVSGLSGSGQPEPSLSFGATTLTNVVTYVVKYDTEGNPLWGLPVVAANQSGIGSIAATSSAEVYVGGSFNGTASFGGISFVNLAPCCDGQMFVAKLSGMEPPVPPAITCQPLSLALLAGNDALFTVGASGTAPLLYQWQLNGTNLIDATNAMLSLSQVTTAQAGAYLAIVSNPGGSVTSSNAFLAVYNTAAATLGAMSFSAGQQPQFGIAGVPGLTYIVEGSTNLIDWVPLLTNTSPFNFADPSAFSFPARFYRAVWVP